MTAMDFFAFAIWWGGILGWRKAGHGWFDSITWPFDAGCLLAYNIGQLRNPRNP